MPCVAKGNETYRELLVGRPPADCTGNYATSRWVVLFRSMSSLRGRLPFHQIAVLWGTPWFLTCPVRTSPGHRRAGWLVKNIYHSHRRRFPSYVTSVGSSS